MYARAYRLYIACPIAFRSGEGLAYPRAPIGGGGRWRARVVTCVVANSAFRVAGRTAYRECASDIGMRAHSNALLVYYYGSLTALYYA